MKFRIYFHKKHLKIIHEILQIYEMDADTNRNDSSSEIVLIIWIKDQRSTLECLLDDHYHWN